MQQLMKQAQKMQQQKASVRPSWPEARSRPAGRRRPGDGAMMGSGGRRAARNQDHRRPIVDPDDIETLEDLVLAAMQNAGEAARR